MKNETNTNEANEIEEANKNLQSTLDALKGFYTRQAHKGYATIDTLKGLSHHHNISFDTYYTTGKNDKDSRHYTVNGTDYNTKRDALKAMIEIISA